MLKNKIDKKFLLSSLLVLSTSLLISCGGSDSPKETPPKEETPPVVIPPDTVHHETDSSQTTTTNRVSLASNTFTTSERNFSGEVKVTDAMMVSSTVGKTHSIGKKLKYIGVQGDYLVAWVAEASYDTEILSFSLSKSVILDERKQQTPDISISGVSFNGVIMTIDGGTDIDYHHIDKGIIGKHFFTRNIKNIDGHDSSFLSFGYLGHTHAYIHDSDEVYRFPIHDTTSLEKVFPISLSIVEFTADENFLYISESDLNNTTIVHILNKKDNSEVNTLHLANAKIKSITVDANYIYLSDQISKDILVYNKHTLTDSGKIMIGAETYIDYANKKLYIYRDDTQNVEEHTVTFAP